MGAGTREDNVDHRLNSKCQEIKNSNSFNVEHVSLALKAVITCDSLELEPYDPRLSWH